MWLGCHWRSQSRRTAQRALVLACGLESSDAEAGDDRGLGWALSLGDEGERPPGCFGVEVLKVGFGDGAFDGEAGQPSLASAGGADLLRVAPVAARTLRCGWGGFGDVADAVACGAGMPVDDPDFDVEEVEDPGFGGVIGDGEGLAGLGGELAEAFGSAAPIGVGGLPGGDLGASAADGGEFLLEVIGGVADDGRVDPLGQEPG